QRQQRLARQQREPELERALLLQAPLVVQPGRDPALDRTLRVYAPVGRPPDLPRDDAEAQLATATATRPGLPRQGERGLDRRRARGGGLQQPQRLAAGRQ